MMRKNSTGSRLTATINTGITTNYRQQQPQDDDNNEKEQEQEQQYIDDSQNENMFLKRPYLTNINDDSRLVADSRLEDDNDDADKDNDDDTSDDSDANCFKDDDDDNYDDNDDQIDNNDDSCLKDMDIENDIEKKRIVCQDKDTDLDENDIDNSQSTNNIRILTKTTKTTTTNTNTSDSCTYDAITPTKKRIKPNDPTNNNIAATTTADNNLFLKGTIICLSNIESIDKEFYHKQITQHGGVYTRTLDIKTTTHLIIVAPYNGLKYTVATNARKNKSSNIVIVTLQWLQHCIQYKQHLNEHKYFVDSTTCSTKNESNNDNSKSTIVDIQNNNDVSNISSTSYTSNLMQQQQQQAEDDENDSDEHDSDNNNDTDDNQQQKYSYENDLNQLVQTETVTTVKIAADATDNNKTNNQKQQDYYYNNMNLFFLFSEYQFYFIGFDNVENNDNNTSTNKQSKNESNTNNETNSTTTGNSNSNTSIKNKLCQLVRRCMGTIHWYYNNCSCQSITHIIVQSNNVSIQSIKDNILKYHTKTNYPYIVSPEWIISCYQKQQIQNPYTYQPQYIGMTKNVNNKNIHYNNNSSNSNKQKDLDDNIDSKNIMKAIKQQRQEQQPQEDDVNLETNKNNNKQLRRKSLTFNSPPAKKLKREITNKVDDCDIQTDKIKQQQQPIQQQQLQKSISTTQSTTITKTNLFRGCFFIIIRSTPFPKSSTMKGGCASSTGVVVDYNIKDIENKIRINGGQIVTLKLLHSILQQLDNSNNNNTTNTKKSTNTTTTTTTTKKLVCYAIIWGTYSPIQLLLHPLYGPIQRRIKKYQTTTSAAADVSATSNRKKQQQQQQQQQQQETTNNNNKNNFLTLTEVTPLWLNVCCIEHRIIPPDRFVELFLPKFGPICKLGNYIEKQHEVQQRNVHDSNNNNVEKGKAEELPVVVQTQKYRISITGYIGSRRTAIIQLINDINAIYDDSLHKSFTTHLLYSSSSNNDSNNATSTTTTDTATASASSNKYKNAILWNIPTITIDWLFQLILPDYYYHQNQK